MKFYRHQTTLLERTKLLEGIVCQSLTFTNLLGKKYNNATPTTSTALVMYDADILASRYTRVRDYFDNLYSSPIIENGNVTVKSVNDVASSVADIIEQDMSFVENVLYTVSVNAYDTYLNGEINNEIINQSYSDSNQDQTYSISDYAVLEYRIAINLDDRTDGYTVRSYVYTVRYQIETVETKYPTKPWTITSGINRVLDLAEPIYSGETPRFELNPIQAQKWNNTPLPNTTMTQCTLREQLQHIGNYVHGQARLGGYLNETLTYNGKTYSAGYYENMIFYDEYGNQKQSTLQGKPYVANQIRHSINEYNTKIETNAQNIVNTLDYADGVVTTPDSLNFKTLRTESINIRLSESNCIIETELPIYDIISVKVKAYSGDGNAIWIDSNGDGIWDITPFVFEAHEYSNLSSYGGAYPYSKKYAIYYSQGQKNIDGLFVKPITEAGESFGTYWTDYSIVNILESVAPSIDWASKVTSSFPLLSFQVSYIPFYETKYSHTDGYILGQERKQPFSKIYNQSENVIETRFYGENIKGVAQRLGNKEAARTYILGHINDVPKTGTKLDGYYISQVVTEYMPLSIKCTVGLTENFNRLSQNVGINSHKRVAEVSEREAYDRNILIKEYICIGDETPLPLKADKCQYRTEYATIYMLTGENMSQNLNDSDYDIQTVAVSAFYHKDEFVEAISLVKSPVVSSAFGNCMTFSWNMKDNYSAGTEVVKLDNGYWQKDVPYGDYYGRVYYMDFDLYKDLPQETGLNAALSCQAFIDGATIPRGDFIRNITPYKLRKDSREIIKMNLAIEYVTNRKDLIIGSAMAYCNILVSSAKKGKLPKVYFFADKTRAFDNIRGRTVKYAGDLVSSETENNSFYFELYLGNFKSWAIAYPVEENEITVYDEDTGTNQTYTEYSGGEILIACNNDNNYYVNNGITEEHFYIKKYSDRNKDYGNE